MSPSTVPGSVRHGTTSLVTGGAIGATAAVLFTRSTVLLVLAVSLPFMVLTSLRTKVLTYFALLPLVGWAQIHIADSWRQIPALMTALIAVHIGWELVARHATLPVQDPVVLGVGLLATAIVIQSRNPITLRAGDAVAGAGNYLGPLVIFAAGLLVLRSSDDARAFLRVGLGTAAIVGAYAVKQILLGFDSAERAFFRLQPGTHIVEEQKIFSTLVAPNVYGFVTGFFLLLCLAAIAAGIASRLSRILAVVSAVGLVAAGLRISLIAIVPALFMLLGMQLADPRTRAFAARILGIVVASLVLVGALVLVTPVENRLKTFGASNPFDAAVHKLALLKSGTADEDFASRAGRIGEFTTYMRAHPGGSGPGIVGLVTEAKVRQGDRPPLPQHIIDARFFFQHDFYWFAVGLELGVAGLVVLPLLLLWGVKRGIDTWQANVHDPVVSAFASLAVSTVLLVVVNSLTNESFLTPQVGGYVWFVLAGAVNFRTAGRDGHRGAAAPVGLGTGG